MACVEPLQLALAGIPDLERARIAHWGHKHRSVHKRRGDKERC
jgi:hypothetical protein